MVEYPWQPWRFEKLAEKEWENLRYHRKFFDNLAKILGFEKEDDWYKGNHVL
jgi:hypothetical protein